MNDSPTPEDGPEYYSILGLPPGAPIVQVRAQFRQLAKRFHPDVTGGDARHQEQFRSLHGAYVFLTDPKRKADYDTRFWEPPGPAGTDTDDAGSCRRPASPWVRAGLGTPVASDTTKALRTGKRRSAPRAVRAWIATGLTWVLTVCVLSSMAVMMRVPPVSTTHTSASASNVVTPSRTRGASETETITAVGPGSHDPTWRTIGGQPTEPAGAAALSGDDRRGVPDLLANPGHRSDSRYAVDSQYTTVNTRYTAVDPKYLTVDTHLTSVDARVTGVDPRYTSIDPKLTSP